MNDDLISRLIAGPGSRELDADIAFASGYFDYKLSHGTSAEDGYYIARGEGGDDKTIEVVVRHLCRPKGGMVYQEYYPPITTSIDAALAFAMGLHGGNTTARILVATTHQMAGLQEWDEMMSTSNVRYFDALPRYICAEALKARTE